MASNPIDHHPGEEKPVEIGVKRKEPTLDSTIKNSSSKTTGLIKHRDGEDASPASKDLIDDWPVSVRVECKLDGIGETRIDCLPAKVTSKEASATSKETGDQSPGKESEDDIIAGPSSESLLRPDFHFLDALSSTNLALAALKSSLHVKCRPSPTTSLVRPFPCELCDFRGKYRSDLDAHMRTHTGEKPFSCSLCDYRCTHSSHLKYHMRTHTGEKPFACNICNYRCIHAGRLKDHMMSHTGEKPYTCDLCDFKCSRTGILKRHMRIHTGERPYACDICDYRCSETGTLKAHKRTHSGERPYACDLCNYRCIQASALRKHKKIHSNERPFACEFCEYRCNEASSLKVHMRVHSAELDDRKTAGVTACTFDG